MSRLLFIVSAPRSGSNFLRGALDAHPEITMTVEAGWVAILRKTELLATTPAMEPIDDGEGFRAVGVVSQRYLPHVIDAFRAGALAFADAFHRSVGADRRYIGDKVHSHNDLEFLLRTFPDVRVVYLVRDVRDVLVSSYTFQAKQVTAWQDADFPARCEHLAAFVQRVGELLADRPHVQVRYEDLVADPHRRVAAVLEWLGLDRAPAVDEWLDGAARELFAAHGTSASPDASIGRWRSMLSDEQRALVIETLSPQLRALGYE